MGAHGTGLLTPMEKGSHFLVVIGMLGVPRCTLNNMANGCFEVPFHVGVPGFTVDGYQAPIKRGSGGAEGAFVRFGAAGLIPDNNTTRTELEDGYAKRIREGKVECTHPC